MINNPENSTGDSIKTETKPITTRKCIRRRVRRKRPLRVRRRNTSMARPIPVLDLREVSKKEDTPTSGVLDRTIDTLSKHASHNTVFIFGKGSLHISKPSIVEEEKKPATPIPPKPPDPSPSPQPPDRPTFVPSTKPLSSSPKIISPSSIPNPSPTVATTRSTEGPTFPGYGGFLYSVPGYSAFQPVGYQPPLPSPLPLTTQPAPHPPFFQPQLQLPPKAKTPQPASPSPRNKTPQPVESPRTPQPIEQRLNVSPQPLSLVSPQSRDAKQDLKRHHPSESQSYQAHEHKRTPPPPIRHFQLFKTKNFQQQAQNLVSKPPKNEVPLVEQPHLKRPMPLLNKPPSSQHRPHRTPSPAYQQPGEARDQQNTSDFFPFPPKRQKINPDTKITQPEDTVKITNVEHTQEIKDSTVKEKVQKSKHDSLQSKSSINQGTTATGAVPSLDTDKVKPVERFSLKTSIPISKIDMKSVSTHTDVSSQVSMSQNDTKKLEIQSNVVIKKATAVDNEKQIDSQSKKSNNNISALLTAAETINKEPLKWKESKETQETQDKQTSALITPNPSPNTTEESKASDVSKNDQKNQILLFQNKKITTPKMLLAISQQQNSPQVLLQRTNYDQKNLLAPSRLLSGNKKNKEDTVGENITSSKVVAFQKLHQGDCDENDFENLITENQIYGNKIVVKEKSQGTHQEQELKNNKLKINEKSIALAENKNVVLQQNVLYLSNVHIPGNLMMIKNNTKFPQNTEAKIKSLSPNENIISTKEKKDTIHNVPIAPKEVHLIKANHNTRSTTIGTNTNNKNDIVFSTAQKVMLSQQIVYQVPVLVDTDPQKLNTQIIKPDYMKLFQQNNKKDLTKIQEQNKSDKLFIACPYQMDTKTKPKILFANIRPKRAIVDEVSSLDLYEKRKRLRRLKYLENKDKEQKTETKKPEKNGVTPNKSVITPDKMKEEICKEFANTKGIVDDNTSETDSDYDDNDLNEYQEIIEKYSNKSERLKKQQKVFLSQFNLATPRACKARLLDKQERSLSVDRVASACIAAGRLDRLPGCGWDVKPPAEPEKSATVVEIPPNKRDFAHSAKKIMFMVQMKLMNVSAQYKEEYERIWQTIVKDREIRNGLKMNETPPNPLKIPSVFKPKVIPQTPPNEMLETNSTLQILTEINKSMNENHNLMKMRLDNVTEQTPTGADKSSIHDLAVKNFTELSKLSNMADQSVKLFSGKDFKNLTADKKSQFPEPTTPDYQGINIPNMSKIVALKSLQEPSIMNSSPATSMDEPKNSAAGQSAGDGDTVTVTITIEPVVKGGKAKTHTAPPVTPSPYRWPGIEAVMKSYRKFDAGRLRGLLDLQLVGKRLRAEGARLKRAAAAEAEQARQLYAERHAFAADESRLRAGIDRLLNIVDLVRLYR